MFRYATTQKQHPVAIRVVDNLKSIGIADDTDYSVLKNKIERKGSEVALFAVGGLVPMALEAADKVKSQTGTEITVINPRFVSGVDEELLNELKADHSLVITIEDGEVMAATDRISQHSMEILICIYAVTAFKAFHTEFKAEELLDAHGISVDKLTAEIISALK